MKIQYSKYNFFIYFFILSIFSILYFFLSSYMYMNCILLELNLMMINSVNFMFILLVDWVSLIFSFLVLFISLMIIIYSKDYLGEECNRFLFLMLLFVLFMLIMIYSPSILGVILGWDGLGISSYCLVVYYQSKDSFNSGFITAASNRLGDTFLILCIISNLFDQNFMFWGESNMYLFFFILACFTKSAQFPFSAWLPAAMAAPTPISSLVHSSTLVTAGVYMMVRFNYLLLKSNLSSFVMLVSMVTIFMAGVACFQEFDLKRIVAFSTLGQLGFMVMILSMGFSYISFLHLLVHALFKVLLFMCVGVFIHYGEWQDTRKMGNMNLNLILKISFLISNFSLMGLPFSSGFYSKDILLEVAYCSYGGVLFSFFLYLMVFLTISYSVRMLKFLMMKNYWILWNESGQILGSVMIVSLVNIFIGATLNWIITENLNLIEINKLVKFIPLMMIFFSLVWGGILNSMFLIYFNNMIYLSSLTKNLSIVYLFMHKTSKLLDQGWFESIILMLKNLILIFSFWLKNFLLNSSMFMILGLIFLMILLV
uniref:NADH-ubiquinone oxidoreductase chain 5 n=1 Tax=Mycopsylla proxima TaxID=1681221 RepID=A0A343UQS6_9HEMI|nr:NADH dehydrogenase subunit 5 [Mycopsylla proxima]AVF97051.1 NADH dehydrogenase subunit 5 [Mycopsylla proxima]